MLDEDDQEFLAQMGKQLDESIQELKKEEVQLMTRFGEERMSELRMYWKKEYEPVDINEIGRCMDYYDRKLIWIWSCLEETHSKRALVGKNYMLMSNVPAK
jgi:hypothetical protein